MKRVITVLVALAVLAVLLGATTSPSKAPTSPVQPRKPRPAVTVPETVPTTTTTLVPKDVFESAQCREWLPLAVRVGWPVEELPMLDRVIWRESRCQPDAWNGHDAGLMQINQIHTEFVAVMGWSWPEDMFQAEANLRFALKLWQGSGWEPWGF